MYTRAFVIVQVDLQNALQNMLRGACKSGRFINIIRGETMGELGCGIVTIKGVGEHESVSSKICFQVRYEGFDATLKDAL